MFSGGLFHTQNKKPSVFRELSALSLILIYNPRAFIKQTSFPESLASLFMLLSYFYYTTILCFVNMPIYQTIIDCISAFVSP